MAAQQGATGEEGRPSAVRPECESWSEESTPELRPLPPDPSADVEFPGDVEPPSWLDSWFAGLERNPESAADEGGPLHLPEGLLAELGPGELLLGELEATDMDAVDEYHLVEMVAGYQRIAALAHSRMTRVAGHLSRRPALNPRGAYLDPSVRVNVTAQELAPRLGLSKPAARRLVDNARLFGLKLEDTGAALEQGHIDYPKACAIARLLKDQPDDVAWEVQQQVLPDAGLMTITQLERAVSRAIISIDPARATARHRAASEQRRVCRPRPLPDGMASIFAVLPATDAAGLDLALEAAAHTAKAAGDLRTNDQLRADALALMAHGALENGFIGIPQEPHAPGGADVRARCADADADADADAAPADAAPAEREDPVAPDRPASADPRTDDAELPPLPSRALGPDAQEEPTLETGNAFLRTPRMPIGSLGGCRAQVKITVPLSVLLSPEDRAALRRGDSSAPAPLSRGDSSAPAPLSRGDSSATVPGAERTGEVAQSGGDPPEDEGLPEDWYYGEPVEVAELDGYGPVTPDVARELALRGGTWQRLVTDPLSGALLDVGRTRYRPPAAIADFVRDRDRTCVAPGCSCSARSCQLDHVVGFHLGGVTSSENLGPLCTADHPGKTIGAFELRHLGAGTFQWTTPSGHHYLRHRDGRITRLSRSVRTTSTSGELAAAEARTSGLAATPPF